MLVNKPIIRFECISAICHYNRKHHIRHADDSFAFATANKVIIQISNQRKNKTSIERTANPKLKCASTNENINTTIARLIGVYLS